MVVWIKKILQILCGILFVSQSLLAESVDSANRYTSKQFVFNHSLLNPKSIDFFNETSLELFSKTGVNLYIFAGESLTNANNKSFETYDSFKNDFIQTLDSPYVAIIVIKNHKKIDIISSSDDILSLKNRKKIYWEYMVPLLPHKEVEANALSAVIFNGYVEAIDLIADNFNVKIDHNIPKNEKGANLIAKGILYIMLFSMIGILVLIYIFRNKRTS